MGNVINQANLDRWIPPLLQRRELLLRELASATTEARRSELLICQADNERKLVKLQGLLVALYQGGAS